MGGHAGRVMTTFWVVAKAGGASKVFRQVAGDCGVNWAVVLVVLAFSCALVVPNGGPRGRAGGTGWCSWRYRSSLALLGPEGDGAGIVGRAVVGHAGGSWKLPVEQTTRFINVYSHSVPVRANSIAIVNDDVAVLSPYSRIVADSWVLACGTVDKGG